MDWGIRHKITIIGTIVAVITIVLSIVIYVNFFKKEPTCFDNKKNQNERGIDCGGVCDLMCSVDVRPITSLWVRAIRVQDGIYSVVAYIENQNIGNGTERLPYEIRLYTEQGILATEPIRGETFLGPNDRTAIFEKWIKTGNLIPKTAFITFPEPAIFKKVPDLFNDQNLVIENDFVEDLETAPKLFATVRNTTFREFSNIPVVVILYNAKGNVVATSQTVIDYLGPEDSATASFYWPDPFPEPVVRREIIPRINPFLYIR